MNRIVKITAMFVVCLSMFGILGAMPVKADFTYTPVIIGVTTTKTYTQTLNGQTGTNSDPAFPGTATQTLWFNSTDGNTKYQNASVIGANTQVGPSPVCTTPIMTFKNTGTVTETLSVKLNNTVTGMVFYYNSSLASGSTTGTPDTALTALAAGGSNFVTGLGLNNVTNLCIWANFSSMTGGQYNTWFNFSSN